jgi:hypothetical protein
MLHSLAGLLGVPWSAAMLAEFSGCLGTSVLLRYGVMFGIRELVKLVPGYGTVVGGAAAAAAASFAATYAIGYAALLYLKAYRAGARIDAAAVAAEFTRATKEATGYAEASRMFGKGKDVPGQ